MGHRCGHEIAARTRNSECGDCHRGHSWCLRFTPTAYGEWCGIQATSANSNRPVVQNAYHLRYVRTSCRHGHNRRRNYPEQRQNVDEGSGYGYTRGYTWRNADYGSGGACDRAGYYISDTYRDLRRRLQLVSRSYAWPIYLLSSGRRQTSYGSVRNIQYFRLCRDPTVPELSKSGRVRLCDRRSTFSRGFRVSNTAHFTATPASDAENSALTPGFVWINSGEVRNVWMVPWVVVAPGRRSQVSPWR